MSNDACEVAHLGLLDDSLRSIALGTFHKARDPSDAINFLHLN